MSDGVYILSIEAADIYNHMFRKRHIKKYYCAMLPKSLELNKLVESGLEVRGKDKMVTDDVINVKFNCGVKSGEEIVDRSEKQIDELGKKLEKIDHSIAKENLQKQIIKIKKYQDKAKENEEKWHYIGANELRYDLYKNGFIINDIKYILYKRSSSKSRKGQVLFIREELHPAMVRWSHMNLDFSAVSDLPSVMAYESLVSSGMQDIVKIDPDNILIVADVENKFRLNCNVVKAGKDGLLDSFEEEAIIKSDLFDGQSLLQTDYFPDGKSMMLLRNHMFKSAAFKCDIRKFLRDNCPPGINFNEWKIPSLFGDMMLVKDIHMITTPNSLKSLKFKVEWGYWKQVVKNEGCVFGLLKYDESMNCGFDDNGRPLQQMSYQMLNSLPASKKDINELASYEREFIRRLKSDADFFINYIKSNISDSNGSEMWANLYELNSDITGHEVFRNFRSKQISDYVRYLKSGKIRLPGDYCYIVGNPIEMLYHSIKKPFNSPLKENQIYTRLFDFGKEYVAFRNPHTSPSNVLVVQNTDSDLIGKYLPNLSKNIIIVNAIDFPIQRKLSGMDYDSDTAAVFDHPRLLEIARKCKSYKVCVNGVDCEPQDYEISNESKAQIDNILGKSQYNIGVIVNIGQWAMSRYWNLYHDKKQNSKKAKEYLRLVDVCTVLSEISIDMAKKLYRIDLDAEIRKLNNKIEGKKPLFFRHVSQNENVKIRHHDCPMDYLQDSLETEKADDADIVSGLRDLLKENDFTKRYRKQTIAIIRLVKEMDGAIRYVQTFKREKKEKDIIIQDIINKYEKLISRRKVKPVTMYALLILAENEEKEIFTRLLTVLQRTQKQVFNQVFRKRVRKTLESLAI